MPTRLVGVLGGMGPSATADFYSKLIAHTPATVDQEHLRVVLWADPTVPSRQDAVLAGGVDPSPWLEVGVDNLIACGAEIVVTPCNTVHQYLRAVMRGKPVEFIDIIDTAVGAVARQLSSGAVGVLATDAALHAGLYQDALCAAGFDVVLPDSREQDQVTRVVEAIKAGHSGDQVEREAHELVTALAAKGAAAVIVGCTELSSVLDLRAAEGALVLVDPAVELAISAVRSANDPGRQPL